MHKLIQKGAKNTINITNQRFLENYIPVPNEEILSTFVKLIADIAVKLKIEQSILDNLQKQKKYLLMQMFI